MPLRIWEETPMRLFKLAVIIGLVVLGLYGGFYGINKLMEATK